MGNNGNCTPAACKNCRHKYTCYKSEFCKINTIEQNLENLQRKIKENTELLVLNQSTLDKFLNLLDEKSKQNIPLTDKEKKIESVTETLQDTKSDDELPLLNSFTLTSPIEQTEDLGEIEELGEEIISEEVSVIQNNSELGISIKKPEFIMDSKGKMKKLSTNIFGKQVYKTIKP